MRAVITGGAGFIGSNFVRRILDGTLIGVSEIVIIDKLTYAGSLTNFSSQERQNFEFIKGDICDENLARRVIRKNDVIVNFAAESHVDRSIDSPNSFVNTNILGTQNLLEIARQNDNNTFIQISTDEVYGSIDSGLSFETDNLLPNSPYAASKASSELLARSYKNTFDMDIRITRCSNNYGPYQFPEKLIPVFITNLIDSIPIPIYGDGENIREWIHVDDHCRAINSVIFEGSSGDIFNIGSGVHKTNNQIAELILESFSLGPELIKFVPDRRGHDIRYALNSTRIANILGFKPLINFESGIMETITWYKEHENWWRPLKRN